MNHYNRLHVARNADAQNIKRAFYRQMRLNHPDHGGDTNEARLLIEAYEVLMDPQKRARYDLFCRHFYREENGTVLSEPDKRGSRRVPLQHRVIIKSVQGEFTARFVDYSSGGGCVTVSKILENGMPLEVQLENGRPMAHATVARWDSQRDVAGLKWRHVFWENIPKGFIKSFKL